MKILAIDSSGIVASAAVAQDDNLLGEYTINHKKTHSQTLLPMIDEVVRMLELDLHTIDAIAVAAGPGSFTGLRIGCATAKGMGLALEKPLIQIPTVDGLAYNLAGSGVSVCPLMDARRSQVYTGIYEFEQEELKALESQTAVSVQELTEKVNGLGREIIFLGDGVPVYRDILCENLKVPYHFAPAHMNKQRAGAVAALGLRYLAAGRTVHAREHRPDYLRMSQAERERAEKAGAC